MIDLSITNEEIEALKYYLSSDYYAMNQMLISNCETDIALLSEDVENKSISINYSREAIIEYLKNIKLVYRLILKDYYTNFSNKSYSFFRGTNISEIERLKDEVYIDRMLSATISNSDAKNKYSSMWNRPACMNINLRNDVPYIFVNKYLPERDDILISPFTKIEVMSEIGEQLLENTNKVAKIYDIKLQKQELVELQDKEKFGVYNYVLENAYSIRRRIEECITLEKENTNNFENIRKLTQLLLKYENQLEEKNGDKDDLDDDSINIDMDDIDRINRELEDLKVTSNTLFEVRKEDINYVNIWKRNIAVYMMAECREIEKDFEEIRIEKLAMLENQNDVENDIVENINEIKENNTVLKDNNIVESSNNRNDIINEVIDNEEDITEIEEETDPDYIKVKKECKENVEKVNKLLDNINYLITKQQNHAKIAGNLGTQYSALNNAFDMRKVAQILLSLVNQIKEKVNVICLEEKTPEIMCELNKILKINIEINTLLNYLNNPKIAVRNSKATRFEEMAIIEENELKRGISTKIRDIMGEAELKKLKDDLEIIESKGYFEKILGIFTGKNKIDDFMVEQIEMRQKSIRKTLSRDLGLSYNYSIHEIMAEIEMFINENDDDDLVKDDVNILRCLATELRKSFAILDTKVSTIIEEREGRNLPIEQNHKSKITKKDVIEIETYRFLNKYGYDISSFLETNEPKYQDTTANEIARIVEYINASNIL